MSELFVVLLVSGVVAAGFVGAVVLFSLLAWWFYNRFRPEKANWSRAISDDRERGREARRRRRQETQQRDAVTQQEVNSQKPTGTTTTTEAYVDSIHSQVSAARNSYPNYSSVEDFIRDAREFVESKKLVLGQLGQQHLVNIVAMNSEAALKRHQIGLEHELIFEKVGYKAITLLRMVDVIDTTITGLVERFREIRERSDPMVLGLVSPMYAALLTDFFASIPGSAGHLNQLEAEALLTEKAQVAWGVGDDGELVQGIVIIEPNGSEIPFRRSSANGSSGK